MLTPIQAVISALITAFIVQLISLKLNVPEQTLNTIKTAVQDDFKSEPVSRVLDRTVPKTIQLPVCEPTAEVNKLLDAIFVTHGIEETNENVQKENDLRILGLNESNFDSISSGDWLILAHVPWYSSSESFKNHFIKDFPSAISQKRSPPLNLAILDCHAHPFLAAALQVRQYPSLVLVTESGRLREWPFELKFLNQETISFLTNSHWRHLPVYQLLKTEQHSLYTSALQIQIYNIFFSLLMKIQPKIFDWIIKNRPLTSGIIGGICLGGFFFKNKL